MSNQRRMDAVFDRVGDLLDQQEGPDLAAFEEYRTRPVRFIRDVLGDEPWQAQRSIAWSVLHNSLTTVRSCNAAGKDFIAARLGLWWAYARGGLVLITGPTSTQVEEVLMRGEVRAAFRGANPRLPGELFVKALRPAGAGKAGIRAKTASSVSALTGFHDANVFVIITEGQAEDVRHVYEAALSVATGENDRILAVGNPTRPTGPFHRSHRPDSPWHSIKIPAHETPNVREGKTVVPGLISEQGIERFARIYGTDSATYRSRVLAEFPDEIADGGLLERRWIDAAVERHRDGTFEEGGALCALDPAGRGPNSSVLGVRYGPVVDEFIEWTGSQATSDLVYRVRSELAKRELDDRPLIVDSVGVGMHVADRLAELGLWVVRFTSGSVPSVEDRYRNRRAEAFWNLRLLLEAGKIALPEDEELARQLLAHRYDVTAQGLIQIEKKERISTRLGSGQSPDRADVLAMLFAEPAPPPREREVTDPDGSEIAGSFLGGMRSVSGPSDPRRVPDAADVPFDQL